MPSTSSSSLTNDVPKPPTREQPATRPPYTPTLGGQAPHSHQFTRTRKMFDKGPEQVEKDETCRAAASHCCPLSVSFKSLNHSLFFFFVFFFRQLKTAMNQVVTGTTSVRPSRQACATGAPSILLSLS